MAQVKPTSKSHEDVTIQAVFDKTQAHKDGYNISGRIVELPDNIATLCDKKTVQLTGMEYYYHVTADDLKVKNKDGSTEIMQGRVGNYAVFVVKTVSLFNAKTGKWEVVYTKG